MSSPILVVETLVKPLRDGNTEIEMQYRELFGANAVRLLDASYEVFEDAARLRAETGLATPDALHAATALRAGCALFVTNDTDFRRVEGLPIVVLAHISIWLNIPLSKSSAFFKPLSICETLAVGMAIITP